MVSLARIQANRQNALRSTGPRTGRGKRKARWNALQHGLLSRALLIPGEKARQLRQMLDQVHQELRPVGFVEEMLVEKIAVCYWRLRRAVRYESHDSKEDAWAAVMNRLLAVQVAKLAETQKLLPSGAAQLVAQGSVAPPQAPPDSPKEPPEPPSIPRDDQTQLLLRYESGVERQMYRALAELERRQRRRKGERVPAPVLVVSA